MQIDLARSLVYMRGLYNISWQKRLSHSGSAGKGYITSAAATAAATLVSVNKQRKQEIEKRRVIKRENSSSCRVFFSSQFSCDIDCVSSCGPEGCGWKRARPACAHPTVIYIYIYVRVWGWKMLEFVLRKLQVLLSTFSFSYSRTCRRKTNGKANHPHNSCVFYYLYSEMCLLFFFLYMYIYFTFFFIPFLLHNIFPIHFSMHFISRQVIEFIGFHSYTFSFIWNIMFEWLYIYVKVYIDIIYIYEEFETWFRRRKKLLEEINCNFLL